MARYGPVIGFGVSISENNYSLRIVTTNQITSNLLHNRKTEYSKIEAVKIFIQYLLHQVFLNRCLKAQTQNTTQQLLSL